MASLKEISWLCFSILVVSLQTQAQCPVTVNLAAKQNQWSILTWNTGLQTNVRNMTCSWLISTHGNLDIQVNIFQLDTDQGIGCQHDYLEIYLGKDTKGTLYSRLCGTSKADNGNLGRHTFVVFHVDSSERTKGFKIKYQAVIGGESKFNRLFSLTSYQHWIKPLNSPYFPEHYLNNLNMKWLITANHEWQIVHLVLLFARILCPQDQLYLYDGNSENDKRTRVCIQGKNWYKTSGRKLLVTFTTDSNGTDHGFAMAYLSFVTGDCNNTFLEASNKRQYLTSPNYPHSYPNDAKCTWIIHLPSGSTKLTLTLKDLELEESPSCSKDFLEVYSGDYLGNNATLVDRYCGSFSQGRRITVSSSSTLFMKSDNTHSGRGFIIEYYADSPEPFSCSSSLDAGPDWKTLTSPSYPTIYQPNLHCFWTITSREDFVEIQVDDSLIESYANCIYDAATVYDGKGQEELLGKWCGDEQPSFLSKTDTVTVTFVSDGNYEYRGFTLRYRSLKKDVMKRVTKVYEREAEIISQEYYTVSATEPPKSNPSNHSLLTGIGVTALVLGLFLFGGVMCFHIRKRQPQWFQMNSKRTPSQAPSSSWSAAGCTNQHQLNMDSHPFRQQQNDLYQQESINRK